MPARLLAFSSLMILTGLVLAAEPEPKTVVEKAIKAVGGEEKLLKLFRIKERLNVSADPEKKGNERVSVLEPPKYWWVGKRERVSAEKEPATFLVWSWTLGILTDPKTKMESIPEITDGEQKLIGLKLSETVTPALEIYFDSKTFLLARIDWRTDIHRFSDWKEHDGVKYPAQCKGYKKANGKFWYGTEILSIERLKELPEGLSRDTK
jgi:hypothetical protein